LQNLLRSSTKLSQMVIYTNSSHIVVCHNQTFGTQTQNTIGSSRPLQELKPPPFDLFLHLETIASGLKHFGALLSKLLHFENCSVKPTLHKLSGLINSIQGKRLIHTCSWHHIQQVSCLKHHLIRSVTLYISSWSWWPEAEFSAKTVNEPTLQVFISFYVSFQGKLLKPFRSAYWVEHFSC
jgi:hypothetical protein